jgi:hypothetical protein
MFTTVGPANVDSTTSTAARTTRPKQTARRVSKATSFLAPANRREGAVELFESVVMGLSSVIQRAARHWTATGDSLGAGVLQVVKRSRKNSKILVKRGPFPIRRPPRSRGGMENAALGATTNHKRWLGLTESDNRAPYAARPPPRLSGASCKSRLTNARNVIGDTGLCSSW